MDSSLAHLISWSEPTKGDVPPPLTGPSITISPLPAPHPPTVFLFGGKDVQTRRLTSEMWAMDLATRVWERLDVGPGPGPRYFHSMDVWEDKLVCFGGMSDSEPMSVHNDIWFFDCAARRWLSPPSPSSFIAQDPAMLPSVRYAHLSAISRGQLVVSGGQHADNSWVYELNVYDLRRRLWVSKTEQPEMQGLHSKGAYRSVATSSKQRVISPAKGGDLKASSGQSYSIDEEGEGGDIVCYSNYDFAKVRRELDVISPSSSAHDAAPAGRYTSPPSFTVRDDSLRMNGATQPPGLRFPTGGIVGNHFILCGLYLASSSAAFSIWALNLTTMTWRHLEPSVLATGSWNRAVLWPERARLIVFGNAQYDLATDYGRRAVNLDHVAVVSLETFGIYSPPKLEIPSKVQEVGLTMLDEKLASDFDVVCDDGRRVKCSRAVLRERWAWFAEQERSLAEKAAGAMRDAPALDINDTLLGSFSSARLAPTQLTIPEPFPVCVALVQYFYTLSLSTPLQNRAPILSALLFLAKQYRIDRLARLVVHALHERLEPSIAVGIYEIATLSGEQNLQVRALNMIHSAKHAAAPRPHRQGPGSSQASEGSSAPQYPAPHGGAPGPGNSDSSMPSLPPRSGSTDDGPYRRARAESITLGDEASQAVDNLLAALSMSDLDNVEEIARPDSPIDPTPLPGLTPRHSYDRLPSSRPPMLPRLPSFPRTPDLSNSHRPGSPTNSEATSFLPTTPAESMRESFILPNQPRDITYSYSMDSRSSSSSGHGKPNTLQPLPELSPLDVRAANRSVATSPSMSRGGSASVDSTNMLAPPPPPRSEMRQNPPTSYSSHQAQFINAMANYSMAPDLPSTPTSSRVPSLTMSSASPLSMPDRRHFSVTTQSSASSDASLRNDLRGLVPSTPTSADFNLDFSPQPITRSNTIMSSNRDTMSISSGSTGTSSKRAEKAEKKAIAVADKLAKKAESQARFEALRAEQQRKMAISKAEAQKKSETAAKQAPAPKPAPKSKFGKFGAKFAESVLFPSGGQNSTMY